MKTRGPHESPDITVGNGQRDPRTTRAQHASCQDGEWNNREEGFAIKRCRDNIQCQPVGCRTDRHEDQSNVDDGTHRNDHDVNHAVVSHEDQHAKCAEGEVETEQP